MNIAKKRQRPGLDDKIITSWNAMMLKGYTDAFKATSHDHYLNMALKNGQFIESHLLDEEGRLFRTHKNGKSAINGFLEDYAHCAEAFISLYESSFDEKWLLIAQKLVGYAIKHFYDPSKEIFYFTSDEDRQIVTRSVEKNDNVIPASNSVIQKVLFKLSRFFDDNTYYSIAEAMMTRMLDEVLAYPYSHANWLYNYMNFIFPFSEVVIAGKDYKKYGKDLNLHYLPNVITSGSNNLQTKIPLFQGRLPTDNTQIFVCTNNTCELPVKTISEAIEKLF